MNLYCKPHHVIIAWLLFLASSGIMAQNCNIGDRANDLISGRKCAPVNVDWLITYRGVNDGGTGDVIFVFDWADGTPIERIPATLTNVTTREWKASLTHVYPKKVGFCNYNPNVTIEVNGELCTSSRQYQTVTVWDTDEFNGGEMAIDPQVFPICVGNDGSVTFGDASQWNCTPPIENDIPNETKRWTQWVYGTDGNITTALIGGSIRPWPFYGNIIPTTEPIWAPQPPGNTSLPIYIPNGYAVNDFFEVTLRNWNYCNPYDDPEIPGTPVDAINGDHPPVLTTAMALIVPYPDATITPVLPMCVNAAAFTLTAVTPGGRWSGPGIENTFTGRFNPTLAGPGTHTITYRVGNAYGCMGESTTNITVHDIPTALPTAGLSTFLCPGVSTIINGNPSGGMPPYISHTWSGATTPLIPTNVQSPTFMTVVLGTYNLVYEVTDSRNCRNSATITMLVSPVDISLANPVLNVCTNTTIPLEPKPEGGSQIFIEHLWTGARTDLLSATNVENPYFTSPTTGTFDYDYYVRSDQGCDATVPLQVIVHEYPVADAGSDNQVCGLSYTMAAIPTVGSGSWETISGPGTVTWGDLTNGSSTITVTDYGDYVFRWTENNNSCTSSDEVTITFLETPTPTVMPDAVVCGLTHTLTAYPHNGLGGWQQTSSPATAVIASPTTAVSDVSVPSAGVYQFTWEENNAICIGSATVQITFNPQAQAIVAPVPPPNCSPAEISFVNNSTNGDLYLWDFGDGNTSTAQNPTHTFENYTSALRTYAVTLVVENSYGCNSTLNFNINVSPSPNARFTFTPTRGCSPLTSTFTNLSTGATDYKWDFGDGAPIVNITNAVHQYVNPNDYIKTNEVMLIVSNNFGCTDTVRNYVTVFPSPDASFTLTPPNGCEPLMVDMLAQPGTSQYVWDLGDGIPVTGSHVMSQLFMANNNTTTDYQLSLTATSLQGCSASSKQLVTVYASPSAQLTADKMDGCAPLKINYQNTSTDATTHLWVNPDGSREQLAPPSPIIKTYDNPSLEPIWQRARLVVESNNGCRDSVELMTKVFPKVIARISQGSSGCHPVNVSLNNFSIGANSFEWNIGDGTLETTENINRQFNNTSSSPITFTTSMTAISSFGCQQTTSTDITVFPNPVATWNISPDIDKGCAPYSLTFLNQSTNVSKLQWESDYNEPMTGDIYTPYVHPFNNSTQGLIESWVKMIVENTHGCKDSIEKRFLVFPMVTANISPGTSGCSPHTVYFENTSTGANSFVWDFGDGTIKNTQQASHTFSNINKQPIQFTTSMTATSSFGCQQTTSTDITVFPNPIATWIISPDIDKGCTPYSLTFLNQSTNISKLQWESDSNEPMIGDTSTPYIHIFNNLTQETIGSWVKMSIENTYGCKDSIEKRFRVFPMVTAQITQPTNGCSPHNINITNLSSNASAFLWEMGDGRQLNSLHAWHSYNIPGNFTIKLIASSINGCSDTTTTSVIVYPTPVADFSPNPNEQQLPLATFNFFNQTLGTNWLYQWDFGDTQTSNNRDPEHTYSEAGRYEVKLVVSSEHGCTSSMTHTVHVIPQVPFIDYGSPSEGCLPLLVQFYNITSDADEFLWEFGDNTSSTVREPSHVYDRPGIYRVKLTATGEGGTSSADNVVIVVHERPVALFDLNPTVVTIPDHPVNFRDLSTGNIATWLWDFGDSNRASVQNPQHLYTQPGSYTVTLTVTTPNDCQDDYILNAAVTALEGGEIKFPNAFTPSETGPTGGVYTERDPSNTVFFPFTKEGVVEYKLQIFNRWGELLFESNDVTIGWDGYYKGTLSRQDVYIWKAVVKFSNGTVETFSGDVTLLR